MLNLLRSLTWLDALLMMGFLAVSWTAYGFMGILDWSDFVISPIVLLLGWLTGRYFARRKR